MEPFMPPPPSCTYRYVHDDGITTRKLMFGAAGSIGAMAPVTRQCAGLPPPAATQVHSLRVTAETGSPMSAGLIVTPRRVELQSAAVTTTGSAGGVLGFGFADASQVSAAAAASARARRKMLLTMCLPRSG